MADLNQTNVFIQVRIEEDTPQGRFNDCLYYSPSTFEALKEEDLQAAKDERVTNWLAFVEAESQKTSQEPTKEELETYIVELQSQINLAQAKINVIDGK